MCVPITIQEKGSVDGWLEPARTLNGRRVGPGALGGLWDGGGVMSEWWGKGNTELNDVKSSKGLGAHQAPLPSLQEGWRRQGGAKGGEGTQVQGWEMVSPH